MIGRTLGVIGELGFDLQPAGWRLTDAPGVDHRRARSLLAQDLDTFEELTQGYEGELKLQLAGPWTLASSVEKPRGDRVLSDVGARRELAQALAEGARDHLADVQRRVPGATLLLQLDEPSLPAVMAGQVPTASGFNRHRSVTPPAGLRGAGVGLRRGRRDDHRRALLRRRAADRAAARRGCRGSVGRPRCPRGGCVRRAGDRARRRRPRAARRGSVDRRGGPGNQVTSSSGCCGCSTCSASTRTRWPTSWSSHPRAGWPERLRRTPGRRCMPSRRPRPSSAERCRAPPKGGRWDPGNLSVGPTRLGRDDAGTAPVARPRVVVAWRTRRSSTRSSSRGRRRCCARRTCSSTTRHSPRTSSRRR